MNLRRGLLILLLSGLPSAVLATELALTIDDLPWSADADAVTARSGLVRLATVLRAQHAPATGFVICQQLRSQRAAIHAWVEAGLLLGNHGWSHRDLNRTPAHQWLNDAERCDQALRAWSQAYRGEFRFPMLHEGADRRTRDRVAEGLIGLGLRPTPVSIDTSEWLLAGPYRDALTCGDAQMRARIGREFVRHVRAAVKHATAVAYRKWQRPVRHILLLHAHELLADHLEALLVALRQDGVQFVPLAQALADPLYGALDRYVGPQGLSKLYRVAPLDDADVAWDDNEARSIREAIRRWQSDRAPIDGWIAASPRASACDPPADRQP